MCGSYGEQIYTCLERKPLVVCCKQGKANVPNWLFGIANHRLFFDNWDDVKTYIHMVDNFPSGIVPEFNKFRFIDYAKVFNANSRPS